jgi:YD repeat-containing protein
MKQIISILLILCTSNAFSQIIWPGTENLATDSTGQYGTITTGVGYDLSVPMQVGSEPLVTNPVGSSLKSGGNEEGGSGKKEFVGFPSPNAASLLNLQGDDVSLYQCRISQSIPLAELKSYDLSVPVNLHYSTTGVRVNEIAGWVGHGWNITGGGQITRVMRGLPDEFNGRVQNKGTTLSTIGTIPALGYLRLVEKIKNEGHNPYNYLSAFVTDPATTEEERKRYAENAMLFDDDIANAWDTQPDYFQYNFGGYSGRFMFNNEGEIISIPHNNFIITPQTKTISYELGDLFPTTTTYTIITSFDVTTEDGTIYKFGNDDLSTVELTSYETHNKSFFYRQNIVEGYELVRIGFDWKWYPDGPNEDGDYQYKAYDPYSPQYYDYLIGYIDANNVHQWFLGAPKLDADLNKFDKSVIPDFPSTWYLEEIESVNGNKISYSYNKSENKLEYIANMGESYQYNELTNAPDYRVPYVSPLPFSQNTLVISRTKVSHDNVVLESITGDNGSKILFKSTADRPDLIYGKRLREVEVYDLKDQLVKSFRLDYQDVINPDARIVKYQLGEIGDEMRFYDDTPLYAGWFDNVEVYKRTEESRIFLKGLTQQSPNGELSLATSFEYENLNLPPRFSTQQDALGFYNGSENYYPMPVTHESGQWGRIYNKWNHAFGTQNSRPISIWKSGGFIKFGMLKSIVYPTGGRKEFDYHINSFGGVKVIQIRNYFSDGKIETANYTSEGSHWQDDIRQFDDWYYPTNLFEEFNLYPSNPYGFQEEHKELLTHVLYSNPKNQIPNNLGYSKVAVKKGLGKTEYHFKNSGNSFGALWDNGTGSWSSWSGYNNESTQEKEDLFWQRGHLTDVYTYTETGGVLKHLHNEYDEIESPSTINWSFKEMNHPIFDIETNEEYTVNFYWRKTSGLFEADNYEYLENVTCTAYSVNKATKNLRIYFIRHNSNSLQLVKSVETIYDPLFPGTTDPDEPDNKDKAIVKVTTYDHNNNNLVDEITNYDAEFDANDEPVKMTGADEFITQIKYPIDFPGTAVTNDMQSDKNMIKVPIETINKKNGEVINASITKYRYGTLPENATNIFPGELHALEIDDPISDYQPANTSLVMDNRHQPKTYFDKYDTKGNLLQAHAKNGLNISYLWAYNQSYPIAKIENADYASVENALGRIGSSVTDIESKSMGDTDEDDLQALFEALRNDVSMKDALISSYTYDPLIGMRSETDPSGKTTYYEYDDLGRLLVIKNHKGEIIKTYEYHP